MSSPVHTNRRAGVDHPPGPGTTAPASVWPTNDGDDYDGPCRSLCNGHAPAVKITFLKVREGIGGFLG